MCGIIGCVGAENTVSCLLSGLSNLEYRGYDSAGIAITDNRHLTVHKCQGEVSGLEQNIPESITNGSVGIGHTRWSTHGPPTDNNAHPHTDCSDSIAVVHNGIIENYDDLRADLLERDHDFSSETDTEVVPHLIEEYLPSDTPETAFRKATEKIHGNYAIVAIFPHEDRIFATRSGSPLVLGIGEDAQYLASDIPAFFEFTKDIVYLEDGDLVQITAQEHQVTDKDGLPVDRPVQTVQWTPEDAQKDGYDHFMLKEINEQPTAIERTLSDPINDHIIDTIVKHVGRTPIEFVACGTSYHAALYAVQLFRQHGIPASATLASEFITSTPPLKNEPLVIGVTQSGETADTLAALRTAQNAGSYTLAVTNVRGSTATRECDETVLIRAGPEIGVAATKTFSSQVATLVMLADKLVSAYSGTPSHEIADTLRFLPDQLRTILNTSEASNIAQHYNGADAYFFVGRGIGYAVALEGALKLKEISYEHAEGFPAGELKHGPLALVTSKTPVIVIDTGRHPNRTQGTIEEIQARGGPVIAVTDQDGPIANVADTVLSIPSANPVVAGLLANTQLQLYSYHAARLLNRPVDKPRNLAKSVTVE